MSREWTMRGIWLTAFTIVGGLIGAKESAAFDAALNADGAWSLVSSTGPYPRYGHRAIYDPVRKRLIIFGGSSATYINETWALSLTGAPQWAPISASGPYPPGRSHHSAVYDSARDRMVIFGGFGGSGYLNDCWALTLGDSPQWTRLTPFGVPPGARNRHSAIYDPVRDRMIIHSGNVGGVLIADTWELTFAGAGTWHLLATSGFPIPRNEHSALYDPVRDRMLIFAGFDVQQKTVRYRNDVVAMTLSGTPTWLGLATLGTPPPTRSRAVAVYDSARDRMVIHGGGRFSGFADIWGLNLSPALTWTQLLPGGTPPAARLDHAAIYDPNSDAMFLYGGRPGSSGTPFNDTWAVTWATPPTAVAGLTSLEAVSVGDGIEVQWGVRSREEYLGFYVLRSKGGGVFERVTGEMIPNAAETFPATLSWTDESVQMGIDYAYRIEVIHPDGVTEEWNHTVGARVPGQLPSNLSLRIVGPNPFRSADGLAFEMESPAADPHARIHAFDMSGRLVATIFEGAMIAGTQRGRWNGTDAELLPVGRYLIRLEAGDRMAAAKVFLVR